MDKCLIDELETRRSVLSLKNTIKDGELQWFQTKALAKSLLTRRCEISLDTGLGKTVVAAAFINCLLMENKDRKILFVCRKNNLKQTVRKLKEYCFDGVSMTTVTGEFKSVSSAIKKLQKCSVIITTYQAMLSESLHRSLINYMGQLDTLIVDESQYLGNYTSYTYDIVHGLSLHMSNIIFLTATPMRTDIGQYINQMLILNKELAGNKQPEEYIRKFERRDANGKFLGWRNIDELREDTKYNYISFTRKDVGMRGDYMPFLVDLYFPYETDVSRSAMTLTFKGEGNETGAMTALKRIVNREARNNQRGLIYANLHEIKKYTLDSLRSEGLRVDVVDGKSNLEGTSDAKIEKFVNGEYDCLITNITTGSDMPCDYICLYELTSDSKQLMGRGERGLSGKDLRIYYFVTMETCEEDFFHENMYEPALCSESLLGKDSAELKVVKTQMKNRG